MKVFQTACIVIACVASAVFFFAMNRPLTQASANVIAFSSLLCLASLLMFGITRAIECFHPARDEGELSSEEIERLIGTDWRIGNSSDPPRTPFFRIGHIEGGIVYLQLNASPFFVDQAQYNLRHFFDIASRIPPVRMDPHSQMSSFDRSERGIRRE